MNRVRKFLGRPIGQQDPLKLGLYAGLMIASGVFLAVLLGTLINNFFDFPIFSF